MYPSLVPTFTMNVNAFVSLPVTPLSSLSTVSVPLSLVYTSLKSTAVPVVTGLMPVAVTPLPDKPPSMLYVTTTL